MQAKLLHGEQYLSIKAPIPTSGECEIDARYVPNLGLAPPSPVFICLSHCSIVEVTDKGKAASVVLITETKDKSTGKVILENQSTLFIRGSGGFGGKRTGKGQECPAHFANQNKCG